MKAQNKVAEVFKSPESKFPRDTKSAKTKLVYADFYGGLTSDELEEE